MSQEIRFAALVALAVAMFVANIALFHPAECKADDPGFRLGHVLMSGCP